LEQAKESADADAVYYGAWPLIPIML
jgi:hypothetical protein